MRTACGFCLNENVLTITHITVRDKMIVAVGNLGRHWFHWKRWHSIKRTVIGSHSIRQQVIGRQSTRRGRKTPADSGSPLHANRDNWLYTDGPLVRRAHSFSLKASRRRSVRLHAVLLFFIVCGIFTIQLIDLNLSISYEPDLNSQFILFNIKY